MDCKHFCFFSHPVARLFSQYLLSVYFVPVIVFGICILASSFWSYFHFVCPEYHEIFLSYSFFFFCTFIFLFFFHNKSDYYYRKKQSCTCSLSTPTVCLRMGLGLGALSFLFFYFILFLNFT